jgi:hypothetical protein
VTNQPRRKRRVGRDVLAGLAATAARQVLNEPENSPRRKPTLPVLKFMQRKDDIEVAPARDDASDDRGPR